MAKKRKTTYNGKKWDEWTPGERMTHEDIIAALYGIGRRLLLGELKKYEAGQALAVLAYNMEIEGAEPDANLEKKFEQIYARKKLLELEPKSHTLEEIREIRASTGKTLEEFAELLGISLDGAKSLVTGRYRPTEHINRVLQFLDWNVVPLE